MAAEKAAGRLFCQPAGYFAMSENFRYLFGPVPSRRLGFSLGVDPVPLKTCTLNCLYCQLGAGARRTLVRREYVPVEAVVAELRAFLALGRPLDYVTFSGSGEPTLHLGLGRLVREAKRITGRPVAVITNGTLLGDAAVRDDLAAADLVLPSLDAVEQPVFRLVNRPHPRLHCARLIDALVLFRSGYRGQLWLEVMLVGGLNDQPAHLDRLAAAVVRIRPERVQLNTVVRPPAVAGTRPLTAGEMQAAAERLAATGVPVEIIADFKRLAPSGADNVPGLDQAVLAALARRPHSAADLAAAFGLAPPAGDLLLARLVKRRLVTAEKTARGVYYRARPLPGKRAGQGGR